MADAVAGADGVMDGTIQFVLVENQSANAANADGLDLQTDSVLCIDWDLDGSTDATIILSAVVASGFAGSDIIA